MLIPLPGTDFHGLSESDLVAFVVQLEFCLMTDAVKDFKVASFGGGQPVAVPAVAAALQHEARGPVVFGADRSERRVLVARAAGVRLAADRRLNNLSGVAARGLQHEFIGGHDADVPLRREERGVSATHHDPPAVEIVRAQLAQHHVSCDIQVAGLRRIPGAHGRGAVKRQVALRRHGDVSVRAAQQAQPQQRAAQRPRRGGGAAFHHAWRKSAHRREHRSAGLAERDTRPGAQMSPVRGASSATCARNPAGAAQPCGTVLSCLSEFLSAEKRFPSLLLSHRWRCGARVGAAVRSPLDGRSRR